MSDYDDFGTPDNHKQPKTDAFGQPRPDYGGSSANSSGSGESVSQKKLVAGLLGIFLGGLGVHKFYLGLNTAGFIMLGASIATILFLPGAVGLLGLVEGIIYLTKSDTDFEREYLQGRKEWL